MIAARFANGTLLALLIGASPAGPASAEPPSVAILANGLQAIVIEDRSAPGFVASVWYAVGSADESPAARGTAHWLEHLLFWGSPAHPLGGFAEAVEGMGGATDARTSYDFTGYWTIFPATYGAAIPVAAAGPAGPASASDALARVLAVEAARMSFAFDPAAADRERGMVAEEREVRVEAFPSAVFDEQRRAALFLVHPYGQPPIGWPDAIAALDLAAARDLHSRAYRPANATVVIVGDLDAAETQAAVAAAFGPLAGGEALPRRRPQEPAHRAARRIEMTDARVGTAAVGRIWLAPSRRPGAQADAAALAVLEALLGDMEASVLATALAGPGGPATEVGASYADLAVDPQTFGVFAALAADRSPAELETLLDGALADFLAGPPDPAAVAAARSKLATDLAAPRNRLDVVRAWGMARATGLAVSDVLAWPAAIAAVEPDDVARVAAAVLRPEASVTGRLLPAPSD